MIDESTSRLSTEMESREVTPLARTSPTTIKIGSRMGVWGLVVGFGAMTAGTLGAPISLGVAIAAMGAGLTVSGIGTATAAWAVLRHRRKAPPVVRAAAVTGIPLGAALTVLGATSLTQWGPLVAVVNAVTPTAAVLGVLVLVMLVVGFFVGVPASDEDEEA